MKRAYLIRHGMTAANENGLYCGATDLPLSEAGRAALLKLRATMRYPDISGLRIYTSGLARTEETLFLLFGETPHESVPALQEMDFGAFEMRAYRDLKDEPSYLDWITGDNEENRCPGGESGEDMKRRVLAGFGRLLSQSGDFLVVAHGGPIAAVMAQLFPDAGRNRYEWQPTSGTGYRIEFEGDRPLRWSPIPQPGETSDER